VKPGSILRNSLVIVPILLPRPTREHEPERERSLLLNPSADVAESFGERPLVISAANLLDQVARGNFGQINGHRNAPCAVRAGDSDDPAFPEGAAWVRDGCVASRSGFGDEVPEVSRFSSSGLSVE